MKLIAKLADFVKKAQKLRERIGENPLPIRDHNDWVERANEYIRKNLDSAYEVIFNDFSGMTFYGDISEHSKILRSIEGLSRRLYEFISDISW